MSVIVKVNDQNPLVAADVKKGDSWELIKVKGLGKDRKTIKLWINNRPSGIREGGSFRVTEITSCKLMSQKDNRGEWHDEISLNVSVEKVGGIPDEMRKPQTKNYESNAPEWSPPPKEEAAPMFEELNVDDEGLPW